MSNELVTEGHGTSCLIRGRIRVRGRIRGRGRGRIGGRAGVGVGVGVRVREVRVVIGLG